MKNTIIFFSVLLALISCTSKKWETQQSDTTAPDVAAETPNEPAETSVEETSEDPNNRHVNAFKDKTLEDGIWFSEAYQERLDLSYNIDSANTVEPLPFVYFSFGGEEWNMDAFDFTDHMVGWEPKETLIIDSVLYGNSKKEYILYVLPEKPKTIQVDRIEVTYKDDYDEDKDGEADDKNTIEVKRYYKDKLLSTKSYYRTYRSANEIANYSLLYGKYKNEKGEVYEIAKDTDKNLSERHKLTKTYFSLPELYNVPVYSIKTASSKMTYVLQADEGGNDYLITTKDAAFGFIRTKDSLLFVQSKGDYIRLKKID